MPAQQEVKQSYDAKDRDFTYNKEVFQTKDMSKYDDLNSFFQSNAGGGQQTQQNQNYGGHGQQSYGTQQQPQQNNDDFFNFGNLPPTQVKQGKDGQTEVSVKLNQQQKESLTNYGINAVKNNMTKENLKMAGNFAAKNTKLVGGMAMAAFSNMSLNDKKP